MADEMKECDELVPSHPRKFSDKYKILYHVGSVPIRKNNLLSVYMPENAMAKIAKTCEATGLSAAKVLALSSQPCECCRGKNIIVVVEGKEIEIPRGLFTAKRQNSGVKIQNKKRNGQ